MWKSRDWTREIAILPQFLAIEPRFVRKACDWTLTSRNFTSVFGDRTSFRAKGLRRTTCKSQFHLSFWRSNFISCERVAPDKLKSQFYRSFWRSNLISCFVPSRWHCPCPRLQERNRKEGEGKRTRGEDVKMWGCEVSRCEDEKMWRCEDVKMRGCEDARMWRWEDVKMWGCEDEKMWRCEDGKMSSCEDVRMWRWEDVKMRGCEDERMWRCEDMIRYVKMRRCEDVRMWRWEDVKICED